MSTLHTLSFAFGAALLAGCASAPVSVTGAAPPSAGPPADDNLNAVVWSQTAVEHDLIYREVFRDASDKLLTALADRNWDALPRDERSMPIAGLAPAVILDIDETVLDNSPYQARLIRDGATFDEFTWSEWCRERAARPLPGALEFARLAAAHGVTVFYLSNRAQDLNEPTLDNLRAAGFPLATTEPVFLGLGTLVEGCEQIGTDKGCRRRLVGRRHRVLLQLGDQIGDFVDVLANTREGRRAAAAPYMDWIGERWFMLPNPTYGAWEPALFDNDWSQPVERRRAAKRAALRNW